ncbi:cytochrome c-type biogenesis protein CcmH [Colwellia sp. M166]|jgi:cytochrome c-type biogenesis protein CcmH|uniref:cytochrome c-type biogenesis protein n=1 Tax=Colwellia sp. M166 TaxID=2583805 RepID=UPI00211E2A42|nr:cytochrome c-type biogenesis protein [Colwellia sp. M166]UUO24678.1 cytochrome c-type biogenesis protein CcmH [Colwellia sp. M166]|tara:strand:+ start:20056 stop:20568 length:513 start_codon:yes stop_codon:yes gene_type:complete
MKHQAKHNYIARLQKTIGFAVSIILLSFLSISSANASPVDTFQFKDEATKVRFQVLSKELRCPKCQNQNLADSNSKIAVDLRKNLYNLLQEGKSDQEIIDFMVYRYGDFVLYRPQLTKQTYILWFGPLVILMGFIVSLIFVLRRRSKLKASELNLSSSEQANLDDILNKK